MRFHRRLFRKQISNKFFLTFYKYIFVRGGSQTIKQHRERLKLVSTAVNAKTYFSSKNLLRKDEQGSKVKMFKIKQNGRMPTGSFRAFVIRFGRKNHFKRKHSCDLCSQWIFSSKHFLRMQSNRSDITYSNTLEQSKQ